MEWLHTRNQDTDKQDQLYHKRTLKLLYPLRGVRKPLKQSPHNLNDKKTGEFLAQNPAQPTPDLNRPENKFSNPEKPKQQSNNFQEPWPLMMDYFSVCPTFWMRYEPLRRARHTVPSGWGRSDTCRCAHPAVLSTICPFFTSFSPLSVTNPCCCCLNTTNALHSQSLPFECHPSKSANITSTFLQCAPHLLA